MDRVSHLLLRKIDRAKLFSLSMDAEQAFLLLLLLLLHLSPTMRRVHLATARIQAVSRLLVFLHPICSKQHLSINSELNKRPGGLGPARAALSTGAVCLSQASSDQHQRLAPSL